MDKKVELSLLGSTATHIIPGVLSSHLDKSHRHSKEGGGAKGLRDFDGDAPVRLLVGKLAGGKLELVRHYIDGGKESRYRSVAEALDGLNRGWLRVTSTDDEPPTQDECPTDLGVDLDIWLYTVAARQYRSRREADLWPMRSASTESWRSRRSRRLSRRSRAAAPSAS